jgi:UDP-N-acetylmuramoyl-tripeptide--D-alanyl-D-alanine ligase
MTWLSLDRVAAYAGGRLQGQVVDVTGVSTDTRTLQSGELFIALNGENFDGHDYVLQAAAKGAAAAMVSRTVECTIPLVLVDDTRLGLGNFAAGWRQDLKPMMVGLTGSNGKTTVKEMIAAIFKQQGRVLATRGNLNNDIGMPLTLLELRPEHEYAVIEMGANHLEEIRYLAEISDPDIGLINNAAPAHLEGFGDLDGVARGKGELFESLRFDAIAILNKDDVYAEYWRGCLHGQEVLSFGMNPGADVQGVYEAQTFRIEYQDQRVSVDLPLPGSHNRMNALAAAACAIAAGLSLEKIKAGLESMQSVAGRLQAQKGLKGARIIDDTYNANPGSLTAAIEYLSEADGGRWLVLGDMGELGDASEELHRDAGRYAAEAGLDRLYVLGELAHKAAESFGSGATAYTDKESLIRALTDELDESVTVLIKGSRSMAMEEVVGALIVAHESSNENGGKHAS